METSDGRVAGPAGYPSPAAEIQEGARAELLYRLRSERMERRTSELALVDECIAAGERFHGVPVFDDQTVL